MNSRWSASLKFLLASLLAGALIPSAFAHLPVPPKRGDIGRKAVQTQVPDFNLIDQEGKAFHFASTRGKSVLVTFIFTTCPDVCPLLTAKFAAIQRSLQEKQRDDYWLLSITTDPEHDTPATLKSYAQQYKADLSRWRFLTGSPDQLEKAWKAFGVTVKKSASGQIQHTALTTLIDRDGVRRVDYYTDKWQEKEILRDISALTASGSK